MEMMQKKKNMEEGTGNQVQWRGNKGRNAKDQKASKKTGGEQTKGVI